jgi:hypothetical protein
MFPEERKSYEDYLYYSAHYPWHSSGIFEEEFRGILEDTGYPYSSSITVDYNDDYSWGVIHYAMIRAGEGPWTNNLLHMHSYEERRQEYLWAIEKAVIDHVLAGDAGSRLDFWDDEYDEYGWDNYDDTDIPDDTEGYEYYHGNMRKGRHGRR